MKKIVWTALVAVVSAASATLAVRGLAYIWRRAAHEDPPKQPAWAKFLVGAPLKKGAQRTAQT